MKVRILQDIIVNDSNSDYCTLDCPCLFEENDFFISSPFYYCYLGPTNETLNPVLDNEMNIVKDNVTGKLLFNRSEYCKKCGKEFIDIVDNFYSTLGV